MHLKPSNLPPAEVLDSVILNPSHVQPGVKRVEAGLCGLVPAELPPEKQKTNKNRGASGGLLQAQNSQPALMNIQGHREGGSISVPGCSSEQ